jgi:fatty-acyl-CoA synthase
VHGIGQWLIKREQIAPHKEAVVDRDRRITYQQLNQRVNRLAGALAGLGLKNGDRLAVLSYNCSEFVEIILAAAKLGLIVVPLNWRLTSSELGFMLYDSETKAMIFDPELSALAKEISEAVSLDSLVSLGASPELGALEYGELLSKQNPEEPKPSKPVDMDTPHIIMYTAGTTGKPKGAVLSQGASFWNAVNLQLAMEFNSSDRNLAALPMFHIGGIGLFTLPMLYVGGTVVIQRTFDPVETLRLLEREDITLFFGVPAMFLFIIQNDGFKSEAFEKVRVVMSGGAPLPASLVKEYHQAGITLQQGFGMSEAAPSIATLSKDRALAKAGSIGRPVFHLNARIVDDYGKPVGVDKVGELLIKGPNVMQGYWNRPEANEEAFMEGWFRTGDLARMDEDGDLFIVDRKKDMFISGGENVYPAEVEDAIYELEQVAEAALIGVPDEKWGEVGRAFVVVKEGMSLSPDECLEHLKTKLAKYKIPKSVVFIDALPRNAAGKVLKNALRELEV